MSTIRIKYILISFIMAFTLVAAWNLNADAGLSNYQQIITPNPNIPCRPGWCLEYVRSTFGLDGVYLDATSAWNNSQFKHLDNNFPNGCYVPIWFSVQNVPEGHVALLCPDGSVYSSSDEGSTTPHHHPSIDDLISYYANTNPLTYLGWSEDIETIRVVQPAPPTDATISISKSEVAVGENVTFTFSAPNNPTSYSLVINDGVNNEVIDCGQNTSYTKSFSKPGDYYSAYIVAEYGIIGYLNSNNIRFRVVGPPTNAAISMTGSEIPVGGYVTFNFSASNATGYVIGIDKAGTRFETKDCGSNKSYTRSFSEYGSYSAYVTAYNRAGSVDSMKIDFTVSPYDFDIMDGEAAIRGYSGPGGNIDIPNILGGAPVTSIGYMAFLKNTSLTGVKISDGVEYIGDYAFDGCTGLTNVDIPQGVTNIGEGTFIGCSSLSTISLPEGITSTGNFTFQNCTSLTTVYIPETVTSIGHSAFSYCTALTSITIPSSVTSIGDCAFSHCSNLAIVNIPQGVASIGGWTFASCTALASITIPSNITSIGDYALSDCSNLTSINIPQGVTSIGEGAFEWCTALSSITIPSSVSSIGDYVFSDCSNLTSVNIPQGVTSIGREAFGFCESLTSITIPTSVTSIGDLAFIGCNSLPSITVDADNLYYTSTEGVLYDKSLTTLIYYPGAKTGTIFSIPQTVISIAYMAFSDNLDINTINIPQGVINISEGAFRACFNLDRITVDVGNPNYASVDGVLYDKTVTVLVAYPAGIRSASFSIPQTVTRIGDFAFDGNWSLTNISIPAEITSVGRYAFECNLANITFESPNTIIYDEEDSNIGEYTINRRATIIGYDPSTAKDYATKYGRTFQVWTDQYQDGDFIYKVSAGQAQIIGYTGPGGDVTIPDVLGGLPVTGIRDYAFSFNSGLTSVYIPTGVASIGEYAFGYNAGLSSITVAAGNSQYTSIDGVLYNQAETTLIRCPYGMASIDIHQGVTSISAGAFSGCKDFTSIVIPQGVTSIGVHAFAGCTALTSIIIPEGVTSITAQVFSGCDGLTSVGLPSTLTSIDNGAFEGCTALTTINIPQAVTSIGYEAFLSCTGLTAINLPAGLTTIGDSAFNATGLISISIPQSVTNIGMGAFMNCVDLTGSIVIPNGVTGVGYGAFMNCANLSSISFSSATTLIGDDANTIPEQATIIGHDPSTAKDYADNYGRTFQIIGSGSNDATLTDLSVDGTTLQDFDPARTEYNVVLPAGTTIVPTVTASVNDTGGATAEITPAISLPGITSILVTAADGITTEVYNINFTVVLTVTVTPESPNVNVDDTPLQVIVPADVYNAYLTTSPIDGAVFLPQISVQSNTSQGDVVVYIINETEVTGLNDWDGTINLPQVVDTGSVTVTPENGNEASVSGAIEIGLPDTTLTFSQPVRILLAGQGGKKAGWILNETFTPIDYEMATDTAEALGSNPDGYITVGSDLVIWTTHFTTFVAYTETSVTGYTLSGQVLVEGDDLTEGQTHYSGGATIELKQGEEIKYSTTSSEAGDLIANGSFSLTGIAAGDYTVVISKAGYLTRSLNLTINSDLTLTTTSNQYHNRIYLWAGDIVSDEYNVIAASDVNYILSKFNSNSTQVGFDSQVDIVKDQYNVISAADVNLMLSNFSKNSTQYPEDIIY